MELNNEFRVAVPAAKTWQVLTDVERVAPCIPGAQLLSVDGDDFTGAVNVTGTTVSISDANALTLGAVSASDLTVNGSAIDQTASGVVVSGTSTLTANTIALNSATNDFGTVAVTRAAALPLPLVSLPFALMTTRWAASSFSWNEASPE